MVSGSEILGPVVAMVGWSMVMWVWMYATRLPAIFSMNMKHDRMAPRGEQMATLPASVRWKADNYNHLMEQPTLFYALAISLAVIGEGAGASVYWAWAYVALRVVHSLVQALTNKVEARFALFVFSNVPMFALLWQAAVAVTQ